MTPSSARTPASSIRGGRSGSRNAADNLSLTPPSHNRFSTGSSVGSVLSFVNDSKYAASTSAFLPFKSISDADPRATFLPADSYGVYERLGGGNDVVDDDDFIHEPGQKNLRVGGTNWRGFFNVMTLVVIFAAIVTLFAGYPIIAWRNRSTPWSAAHVNATGQVADLPAVRQLVDPQTPQDQLTRTGFDGHEYELVFSDEFNQDGRSFYPGDDPYWEAVDLWVCSLFTLYSLAHIDSPLTHSTAPRKI